MFEISGKFLKFGENFQNVGKNFEIWGNTFEIWGEIFEIWGKIRIGIGKEWNARTSHRKLEPQNGPPEA